MPFVEQVGDSVEPVWGECPDFALHQQRCFSGKTVRSSSNVTVPILVSAPVPNNVPLIYICLVKCSWVVHYWE
jgi:hypothetical protein